MENSCFRHFINTLASCRIKAPSQRVRPQAQSQDSLQAWAEVWGVGYGEGGRLSQGVVAAPAPPDTSLPTDNKAAQRSSMGTSLSGPWV